MTKFFVAGIESQGAPEEAAYSELRERSRIVAGCPARSRRIFKLSCRYAGADREIAVGSSLSQESDGDSPSQGSDVVVAILDHGREEAYVVHTDTDGEDVQVRVKRPSVYSVTEFS